MTELSDSPSLSREYRTCGGPGAASRCTKVEYAQANANAVAASLGVGHRAYCFISSRFTIVPLLSTWYE
jgi:hypothetical protein